MKDYDKMPKKEERKKDRLEGYRLENVVKFIRI